MIHTEKMTATMEGDFVLFLIGMRLDQRCFPPITTKQCHRRGARVKNPGDSPPAGNPVSHAEDAVRIAVPALQQGMQILRCKQRRGGGGSRSGWGEAFHGHTIMSRVKGHDKADGFGRH